MPDDRNRKKTPVAVPTKEFHSEEPSGVHGESPLAAIERRQKAGLSIGQTTLDTLVAHDTEIKSLKADMTVVKSTIASVETVVSEVKTETQTQKIDITGAKVDTMLQILDPDAPNKIKKIVHEAIETTTYTREAEEKRDTANFKRKRQLKLLSIFGGIAIAAASAFSGYAVHACRAPAAQTAPKP